MNPVAAFLFHGLVSVLLVLPLHLIGPLLRWGIYWYLAVSWIPVLIYYTSEPHRNYFLDITKEPRALVWTLDLLCSMVASFLGTGKWESLLIPVDMVSCAAAVILFPLWILWVKAIIEADKEYPLFLKMDVKPKIKNVGIGDITMRVFLIFIYRASAIEWSWDPKVIFWNAVRIRLSTMCVSFSNITFNL